MQGVCGKDAQTAALQDLLIYAVKDISRYAHRAGQLGARDRDVDVFMVKALFSTLTNVNFDPRRFKGYMNEAAQMKDRAQKLYEKAAIKAGQTLERLECPVRWWEGRDDLDTLSASTSAPESLARRPPGCRS
jgi:hydroxylamine reductase